MPPRTASIGIFFHLPADTCFFLFFLSFAFHHCCMQCFDHRFCRWCRHSLVPYISSVVPTLDAPFYFVGGADTRCSLLFRRWCRHSPSLRPYKPPTPLCSSGE